MDSAPPPLPSRQNRSASFDAPRPDFGSAPPLPQRPHDPNVYNQPQYNAYNNMAPYNNNYNAGMPVYQNNPAPIPYHNNVHNNSAPLPYQNTPQYNNMPPPIPYHNQPPPNNFPTAIQHPPQIPPHVAMPPQQVMMNAPIISDYNPMQNNAYQVPAPYLQPQQPMQIQHPNAMPVPYTNNNLNVNNMNGVAPPPIAQRASVSIPNQPPKGGIALPMAPKKMPPKMATQPQQPSPSGVNGTSPRPLPGLAQPTASNDVPPRVSPRASVPLPGMVNQPNFTPQPHPDGELAPSRPSQSIPSETPSTTTIIMPARPKAQSVSVAKGQPTGGPPKGAVKKQPIIVGPPKTNQQLGPPPVTRPRSTSTGDAPSVIVPTIRLDVVKEDSSAPPLPARPVSDNHRFESPQPYASSSPVAINSLYTYEAVPQKEGGTKVELVDSTYNKSPNDIKLPRKSSTGTDKPHSPHKIHSIYEVVDEIRTDKVKGGYTAKILEIEERGDLMDSKKKKVKMYKVAVTKGSVSWTIYRRYDQFFEFDKKLKSKKLLPSDDGYLPSKKMFLNSEEKSQLAIERFGQLNIYMEHILSAKIIQESDVLWMFIEPTQLGDVKPEKK